MSEDMKQQHKETTGIQHPRVGWRIAATLALLLFCSVSVRVVSLLQGPVQGPLAVRQIEDNATDYALGHAAAVIDVPTIIEFLSFGVVVAVWISFVWLYVQYRRRLAGNQQAGDCP